MHACMYIYNDYSIQRIYYDGNCYKTLYGILMRLDEVVPIKNFNLRQSVVSEKICCFVQDVKSSSS